MVFVLLLLVVLISLLTLNRQTPVGAEAGEQVARQILAEFGPSARVVIVAGPTVPDVAFADAARKTLMSADASVLEQVNGSPADARQALSRAVDAGTPIDAIAATGDTARWTIYDRFTEVGHDKCRSPQTYYWPTFARLDNLLSVANQTAIYAIIAIGMTMVIITGGIDLSVGSLVALASVAAAILIRDVGSGTQSNVWGVGLAFLGAIGVCGLAGLFNGFMITRFQVPPFITTLAMMMMAKGLALRLSAGESISQVPATFRWIGGGTIMGIPNPVILMFVLYVLAHLVMSQSVFGRYVYAVGGNAEASRLSGVAVNRIRLAVYTICGALAGLGGIIQSSKLGTGDPKLGLMYELDVIAAVVVGGTSLMGGEGRIFGTLIGAFIIAVIKNGMNLMNIDSYDQQVVLGAVVMLAVLIDTLKRGQR
ncbi:MAG: hypothetical protein KDA81_02310 [Planctomycetaceae bacterium]|nr:hypothetical protein [Planctomycetaceae bacterium]